MREFTLIISLMVGYCFVRAFKFVPKLACSQSVPINVHSVNHLSTVNNGRKSHHNSIIYSTNQIFCNVELNSENLEAVGFDMDFTLAQYNEQFDLLAFEGAKKKLHEDFNYLKDILEFEYRHREHIEGLIIDQKRGNVLKIDRHKYVRKVFHGFEELDSERKKALYSQQLATYTESNYVNIDTLFQIVDAVLFMNLVDFVDSHPSALRGKSYEDIFSDIRTAVGQCHLDGTIKDTVAKDPGKYILDDPFTVPMLLQLQAAGKKVFLLTNSLWEYTSVVMEHIVSTGNRHPGLCWQNLFDVAIVGACKPAFLVNDHLSLFRVDSTGGLHNIEDKSRLGSFLKREDNEHKSVLSYAPAQVRDNTFQGGCFRDLHRLLGVSCGNRILYVGDHMFSDILRAKRTLGWRTCLVIPELEHELAVSQREVALGREVETWRQSQIRLDDHINRLRRQKFSASNKQELLELLAAMELSVVTKQNFRAISEQYNQKFNKYWGQIFKAGHQDSRFGKQVVDYACLYTSRASNLLFVDPNRPFRTEHDFMPHDIVAQLEGVGDGGGQEGEEREEGERCIVDQIQEQQTE